MARTTAENSMTSQPIPTKPSTWPTHNDVVADLDRILDEWFATFEQADPDGETAMTEDTKACLDDLGYLQ